MKLIMDYLLGIKKFLKDVNLYFENEKNMITEMNVSLLCGVNLAGIFLLLLFFTITPVLIPTWSISTPYILFFIVVTAFFLFSFYYRKLETYSYRLIQAVCILFLISVLIFVIQISVFPYPDAPAAFVVIVYMFLPVLFVIPLYAISILLILGEIVFMILALKYKTPLCAEYDIFTSLAAVICAHIVILIVYGLRIYQNNVRMQYEKLSTIDSLTGVFNKGTCEQLCRTYMMMRMNSEMCALMIIDLDNFKTINDHLGHKQGDEVLKQIGMKLKHVFRETEIIGRIGGDEFLVLMKDISDTYVVEKRAKQIVNRINKTFSDLTVEKITSSVGVSIARDDSMNYETLFSQADKALYKAKAMGKNNYYLYKEEHHENLCKKPMILIADGTEISRTILESFFENEYTVIHAENGARALGYIEKYRKCLAVVLLDVEMPVVAGFEVLKQVRSNVHLRRIPILTISTYEKNETRALEMGADGVISKPFDPLVVRNCVKNTILNHGAGNTAKPELDG